MEKRKLRRRGKLQLSQFSWILSSKKVCETIVCSRSTLSIHSAPFSRTRKLTTSSMAWKIKGATWWLSLLSGGSCMLCSALSRSKLTFLTCSAPEELPVSKPTARPVDFCKPIEKSSDAILWLEDMQLHNSTSVTKSVRLTRDSGHSSTCILKMKVSLPNLTTTDTHRRSTNCGRAWCPLSSTATRKGARFWKTCSSLHFLHTVWTRLGTIHWTRTLAKLSHPSNSTDILSKNKSNSSMESEQCLSKASINLLRIEFQKDCQVYSISLL